MGRWANLDRDTAARATWATLQTLAERISGGEAHRIADQLRPDVRGWIHTTTDPEGMLRPVVIPGSARHG